MKKTLLALAFLLATAACFAGKVNIIMKDGSLKTGELIGSDEEAYYIKTSENKAETVLRTKIKKVFEEGTSADSFRVTAPADEKPVVTTKKADEIRVEQKPYRVLETGEKAIERRLISKTGDNYMMWNIDIASFEFALLGSEFKSKFDIKNPFLTNYTVGVGMLFWPLDGFATGPYIGIDMPLLTEMHNVDDITATAVGYLSFMRVSWIARWIPYRDHEIMFFLDFRAGARKSNVLWDASILGQPLDVDTFDFKIAAGLTGIESPGFVLGWNFCVADYKAGTFGTGKIDLGGPSVSLVMVF